MMPSFRGLCTCPAPTETKRQADRSGRSPRPLTSATAPTLLRRVIPTSARTFCVTEVILTSARAFGVLVPRGRADDMKGLGFS